VPTQDASDELQSSPTVTPRCPRCGGVASPRRRAPSRLNPFLRSAPPTGQITCEDCGLDFEHAADAGKAPWSTKDSAKDSTKES
jgi:hypothetical protein